MFFFPHTVPGCWRLVPPLFFSSTNKCLTSKSFLLLYGHTHGLYPIMCPHAAPWLMCGGFQLDLIWQWFKEAFFMQYEIIQSSWVFWSKNIRSRSSGQNRNLIKICLQSSFSCEIWETIHSCCIFKKKWNEIKILHHRIGRVLVLLARAQGHDGKQEN